MMRTQSNYLEPVDHEGRGTKVANLPDFVEMGEKGEASAKR